MSEASQVLRQACSHHPERESVARCPECRHTFCRECITDYEGRVICSSCLAKIRKEATLKSSVVMAPLKGLLGMAASVLLAIGFFYTLGWTLLKIPEKFHEGRWYITDE